MHLLAAQPGTISDGSAAVDLGQTPARHRRAVRGGQRDRLPRRGAARARRRASRDWPSLRLASLLQLGHNYSVDLYAEQVARDARLIVARVLGGRGYWPYGVERLAALARERSIAAGAAARRRSAGCRARARSRPCRPTALHRLWRYLAEGGAANAEHFLRYAASLIGRRTRVGASRQPLLRAGLYWPGDGATTLDDVRQHWRDGAPVAASSSIARWCRRRTPRRSMRSSRRSQARGLNPLPLFVASLKDPQSAAILGEALGRGAARHRAQRHRLRRLARRRASRRPFAPLDCPVLQVDLRRRRRESLARRARAASMRATSP